MLDAVQGLLTRRPAWRGSPGPAYGTAVALVAAAIGIRLLAGASFPGVPFINFFPVVVVATFVGGRGPGLAAAVLGAAGTWFFLLNGDGSPSTVASLAVYGLVAAFLVLIIDWLIRSAEQNAALAERNALLLRELHHRVKNHLQVIGALLDLQARRAEPAVRDALREARKRLDVVTTAYAVRYEPGARIDVATPLGELCEEANQAHAASGCRIDLAVAPGVALLSMDDLLPLSLIVHELLANALNHGLAGGAGRVEVSARRIAGGLEVAVADDGGRLPAGFDVEAHAGLGLTIAFRLCQQIGARLSARCDGGTRFAVVVADR